MIKSTKESVYQLALDVAAYSRHPNATYRDYAEENKVTRSRTLKALGVSVVLFLVFKWYIATAISAILVLLARSRPIEPVYTPLPVPIWIDEHGTELLWQWIDYAETNGPNPYGKGCSDTLDHLIELLAWAISELPEDDAVWVINQLWETDRGFERFLIEGVVYQFVEVKMPFEEGTPAYEFIHTLFHSGLGEYEEAYFTYKRRSYPNFGAMY